MGAWGTAIFSDDFAEDVRGEYNALLSIGKATKEAEDLIIQYFMDFLGKNDEEESIFWFSLALAEWNKGRLSERVKASALEHLDSGKDLERWNTPDNQKNYLKRCKVLDDFRSTILSPMPLEKKIKKASVRHCPWKVGSLLAYQIVTNEEVKNGPLKAMWGKYALLQVVQIDRSPISKIVPSKMYNETMIVGVYGWVGDQIPDASIVNHLHFIPIEDYIPAPTPGLIDISPINGLTKESQLKVMKKLEKTFSTQRRIETCAALNWLPYKERKGDISLVGQGPVFNNEMRDFFNTDFGAYGFYNFYPFDYALAECLLPYLK